MNKKIVFLINMCLLILCVACAKQPVITDNAIYFVNGKAMTYYAKEKIVNSDAEDANKKGEPFSISEKPMIISEWERFILVRVSQMYEGEVKKIAVYDYNGNLLNPGKNFEGDFLIFEKAKRIILIQHSFHYMVSRSFVLNHDGEVLREIHHSGESFDFGQSLDDKIFWLITSSAEGDVPVIITTIFDSDGNVINTVKSFKKEVISFSYENNIYDISVKTPEWWRP